MVISKENTQKLINSLFCKPLPISLKIIIVVAIMVLPNLFKKSERLFDPLLLFMAPAWALYVYTYLLPVLRHPRKSDWHAVLSINYNCRKSLAKVFIKNKVLEGTILQCTGLIGFSLLYVVSFDIKNYTEISLQIAYISFVNTLLFNIFLLLTPNFAEYMIGKTDSKNNFHINQNKMKVLFSWKNKIAYTISSILCSIFPAPYHSLTKHRWLYMFRSELIVTFIVTLGVPVFASLFAIYLHSKMPSGSIYLIIFAPFVALFYLTTGISHSNAYLLNLPYYGIVKRTLGISNLIFSCFLTLPYIVCFLFITMFLTPINNFQIFTGIISYLNIVLVYVYRWNYENWSNFSKLFLLITFFVCLISNTGSVENTFFTGVLPQIILMLTLITLCNKRW